MKPDFNTRLGVCIPTYRRPDQLVRCVRSVIAAAEPYGVPIFIVDDSTDRTNEIVMQELCSRYRHIVYERNADNLGIDRNILRSVDRCVCDYAWLLGEDDRMLPDAIETVLQVLDRPVGPPAFVCVNYSYVDHEIAQVLREAILPIEQDTEIVVEEFMHTEIWAIAFIGSCVVNKALWSGVNQNRYVGTYFAHVGTIIESIASRSVAVVARPLILNRVGGAEIFTWSADTYNVFDGWEEMTRRLEPIYGVPLCRQAAASFRASTGYGSLRFLCVRRADRIYDHAVYRKLIRDDTSKGFRYRQLALLIAISPPRAFRAARALREQVLRHRRRKILGFDSALE